VVPLPPVDPLVVPVVLPVLLEPLLSPPPPQAASPNNSDAHRNNRELHIMRPTFPVTDRAAVRQPLPERTTPCRAAR
jgi:hypothetical protein